MQPPKTKPKKNKQILMYMILNGKVCLAGGDLHGGHVFEIF